MTRPTLVTIDNIVPQQHRLRSYDIQFEFPGFRTLEHADANGINVATLLIMYTPRRKVVEFESLSQYVDSFSDVKTSLEAATWTITDDLFQTLAPLYCRVRIDCELNDAARTRVIASRGWKSIDQLLSPGSSTFHDHDPLPMLES